MKRNRPEIGNHHGLVRIHQARMRALLGQPFLGLEKARVLAKRAQDELVVEQQ